MRANFSRKEDLLITALKGTANAMSVARLAGAGADRQMV
jgi:hypothetical protein